MAKHQKFFWESCLDQAKNFKAHPHKKNFIHTYVILPFNNFLLFLHHCQFLYLFVFHLFSFFSKLFSIFFLLIFCLPFFLLIFFFFHSTYYSVSLFHTFFFYFSSLPYFTLYQSLFVFLVFKTLLFFL